MKLTEKQAEVIRKIIYAVETGGQEYGKCRYNDFTPAYANAPSEHAITIGAGQWYGNEAKELLNEILKAYPDIFRKHDTAGIEKDLSKSWSSYKLSKSSAKAKAIVSIINTPEGRLMQDKKMDAQLLKYMNEAEALGVTDVAAAMMCANFRHQGGKASSERILKKTKKPYTLDHLYDACKTDSGNQVGAYKSRQKKVYNWLKNKVENSDKSEVKETKPVTNKIRSRDVIIKQAQAWLGKKESDGSHHVIIDTYNNHKPLPRGYKVTYKDAWCATFVSAVAIKVGYSDIIPRECGCSNQIELFKKLGSWVENDAYIPLPGDIVYYDWDDSGSGNNTGRADHVGIVEKVAGNEIMVIEGNKNDSVSRRTIKVNGRYIRGFGVPKYTDNKVSVPETKPAKPKDNKLSTVVQWNGKVTVLLNVRKWAGKENGLCSFSPLNKGDVVGVCDKVYANDGSLWYYIKYKDKYGFVSSKFISKQ